MVTNEKKKVSRKITAENLLVVQCSFVSIVDLFQDLM